MSRLPLEAFLQRKSSLVFFAGEVRGLTAGAPPAREERLLDVRELAHESFVMLSRDPSPPYHDHVVGLCAAAGFQPKVHFAAAQALTIVAIVASGHGVSLVPETVGKAGIDGLVYIPLRNVEPLPSAYLAWNPHRDVPGLRGLIDTVRNAKALRPTSRMKGPLVRLPRENLCIQGRFVQPVSRRPSSRRRTPARASYGSCWLDAPGPRSRTRCRTPCAVPARCPAAP